MLTTLRHIVLQFTSHSNFADGVKSLVLEVKAAMGADVCSIYLLNSKRDRYVLAATDGLNPSPFEPDITNLDNRSGNSCNQLE